MEGEFLYLWIALGQTGQIAVAVHLPCHKRACEKKKKKKRHCNKKVQNYNDSSPCVTVNWHEGQIPHFYFPAVISS